MCVAILKTGKAKIPSDEVLDNCYKNNKDGCGLAYLRPKGKGQELMIIKTFNLDTFKKALKEKEQEFPNSPMLIHFRAMSKGMISIGNCHPFIIDAHHVFIHNGTISNASTDPKGTKSDTVMFNEETLKLLPKGWWGNPAMKLLIEEYIGHSKLAMLDNKGDYQIYNESKGDWVNGIWYSNTQYKTPVYKQVTHKKTNYNKSNTSSYGAEGEYDDNVDWGKYSNTFAAFHGQNRWDIVSTRYEKFDFDNLKWIDLTIWNNKYLNAKKHTTSDDSAPLPIDAVFEMTMDEINTAALDAGVSPKLKDFTLTLTDLDGEKEEIDFSRCEFCWKPEYRARLNASKLVDDSTIYDLCDECHHNMRTHKALED